MDFVPDFVRARAPNANDDRLGFYFRDKTWKDSVTEKIYRSDDDSPNNAVWTDITPPNGGGGGPCDWTSVTNKPSTFPPSSHAYSSHTGIPSTFPPSPHQHDWAADITGKPATFPPSTHSHAQSDVTGLTAALTGKQDTSAKGQANGYASLDGSGKVPSAQLPASSGPFTVVKQAADQTNATVNLAASNALILPVLANTDYIIEAFLTMRSSLATAGFKVALDTPSSPTLISGGIYHAVSNAGAVSGALQRADAANIGATTGVDTINADVEVYGFWKLRNVNAGNVVLMFAAEVAATITLRQGSVLRAMPV